MSDIKCETWLSVLFAAFAGAAYAAVLHKYKHRLQDTEVGSEERTSEALDITMNLSFFDKRLAILGSFLTSVGFFFMKDIDEEAHAASLVEDTIAKEKEDELADES